LLDEEEMTAFLQEEATEDAHLHVDSNGAALPRDDFMSIVEKCRKARTSEKLLAQRHDPEFLGHLLRIPGPKAGDLDEKSLLTWGEEVIVRARDQAPESREYRAHVERDRISGLCLKLERVVDGLVNSDVYYQDFFASREYLAIRDYALSQQEFLQPGARVERKNRQKASEDFALLYDWLLEEARRGQTIQRYKGLGEMNPEQLWETTMRPETRRLLRVRIEDEPSADDLFSTLMGEDTETRRNFIEANALSVSNLDI